MAVLIWVLEALIVRSGSSKVIERGKSTSIRVTIHRYSKFDRIGLPKPIFYHSGFPLSKLGSTNSSRQASQMGRGCSESVARLAVKSAPQIHRSGLISPYQISNCHYLHS